MSGIVCEESARFICQICDCTEVWLFEHVQPLFRFVGCLPLTTDMSAGHKRMRAGVVQIPMEETAECSGVAGTFSAMGIEEVGCGVGLTQRWGKAG